MSMSFSSSFFWGPYIVLNYCSALTGRQPLFCAARQPVINNLPTHDIGHMNVECPFCHAFHWIDDRVLQGYSGIGKKYKGSIFVLRPV